MHDIGYRAHCAEMRFIGNRAEDEGKYKTERGDGRGEIDGIDH